MGKQKSIKRNFVFNFVRTLMQLIFPIITFPYASRVLLPDGLGKVNFAQSIVSYFGLIASLGIGTYAIREGAKIREDRGALSRFASEIFAINIASTIVAYALFAVALFCVPKFSGYRNLLLITSATILFTTIGFEWLYNALEEYGYISVRSIAFQVISLVLLFVLVRKHDDYLWYAAIGVFANVGSNVLNFANSRKYIHLLKIRLVDCRRHIGPILTIFGMTLTISIYTLINSTMLGFISGDFAVGIYAAANKISNLVLALITSLGSVLLPRLSFYAEKGDSGNFQQLLKKGLDFSLLLAIPAACGLGILSRPIVFLFCGSAYEAAVPVMVVMVPIVVAISISNLIGIQLFMPLRKEHLTLASVAIGAFLNLILNTIFIPPYGAFGAGIATLLAEVTVTAVQLFLARRIIKSGELFAGVWQFILAAAVMSCLVIAVALFLKKVTAQILVGIILGAVSYGACLIVMRNKLAWGLMNSVKKRVGRN